MSYNLFIEHHEARQYRRGKNLSDSSRIGTGWEDDFTNALSFYFSCDAGALEAFCQLILGRNYREPTAIETQYATPDGRPDVVIRMTPGEEGHGVKRDMGSSLRLTLAVIR